jgi:uncharacterized membrane protein YfhO
MVNEAIADWKIVEGDPFSTQNEFARMATAVSDPIFTELEVSEPEVSGGELTGTGEDKYYYDCLESDGSLTWQLEFDEPQDVYVYFEASHCESMKVTIDGQTETYSDQRGHIVHLGICDASKVVTLNFPMDDDYDSGNVKLQIYAFNQDVFDEVYQQLAQSQWQVTAFDSTHLKGSVDVQKSGLLMLSVPYDEGWTILVDGVETDLYAVGEGLTGCMLSEGEHQIEMKYVPQGFKMGAVISLVSILIIIAGLIRKSDRFHKTRRFPVINR